VSPDGRETWFPSRRVDTRNTHGTGCTLSSAIACGLAAGKSLERSVRDAKDYLTGALLDGLNLGKGSGPVNHTYRIK
ncbi:MAG TPA: hydroxymethylpyrimidine/phosphomethylpyrimidine kinase, partial [Ruminococcaceae bacterium]|nr:hydroxymethylpyrimidine/phosphomethylpyrimidine kinase [Oscillospiraceae bacterium]